MDSNIVADTDRAMELKQKTQLNGTVQKIRLAGAVIDIGTGKPAVLHISQIVAPDNKPFKSVTEVLTEGQQIEVWVKRIVRKDDDERVELTMIRPLDMEWRDIKVGNQVKGKIVRLEKFGAFVEIGAERPGLIHISEMAHGYVKQPSDVVKEGDEVDVAIIDVNRRKKQIKLSMKALLPEPEVEVKEKPKAGPSKTEAGPRREKKVSRKPRRKGDEDNSGLIESFNEPPAEDEPTYMEIAMRAAMEKANAKKRKADERKSKAVSKEQEDLLSRTLENKVQTN
jgi:predicted RNA-binding protein with RPS1 domain